MSLKLKKIYFAFKHLGWIFIGLIGGAFILSLTVAIIVGVKSISVPFFICLACAAGFLAVLLVPLILFYVKFYKLIEIEIKLDGYSIYVITNNLCGNVTNFRETLRSYLVQCVLTVNHIFNECDFFLPNNKEISKALDGLYIVFVSDISSEDYFRRWGIKYRSIAGLCLPGKILVVKSIVSELGETALAHELGHVIKDAFYQELKRAGKETCVKNSLGLEI